MGSEARRWNSYMIRPSDFAFKPLSPDTPVLLDCAFLRSGRGQATMIRPPMRGS